MTNNDTLQAYNSMSEEGGMNKLTTLQKLLKESTAGKWVWEGWNYGDFFGKDVRCGFLTTEKGRNYGDVLGVEVWADPICVRVENEDDAKLIAEAHNSLPDILRALQIAMEALNEIVGEYVCEECNSQSKSEEALQEITKLLND